MKYARINQWRQTFPVAMRCKSFGVSEHGYHAWRKRPPSTRSLANARLKLEIKIAHERTRQTYGAARLRAELAGHGIQASLYRIRKLRRVLGLRCKQKNKFKVTTDSAHHLPVTPNLLDRHFSVTTPNRAWASDITYIPTQEG